MKGDKREPVMPSLQHVVDELDEIRPEEMHALEMIYRGATPGTWAGVEIAAPKDSRLKGAEDAKILFHGVSMVYQGKPFVATHFLRVEDTRWVAAVHAAFPGIALKLRNYGKMLLTAQAKLDQEKARTRDATERATVLDSAKKSLDSEMAKTRKLVEELEARTVKLAQENNAGVAARAKLEEELRIANTKLSTAAADSERAKDELTKAKAHTLGLRQGRPLGVGRKGRRYLVNALWFRQLPWTGCNFKLSPLTTDEAAMLCREPFTSHLSRRQEHLAKSLSVLLGIEVRQGVGQLDLKPGDDAIIVEYRGPHVPDNRELSANEFRAWQMGLQWFHLHVEEPTS